jgi:peptide-methionine (S)-S-oxide reductase
MMTRLAALALALSAAASALAQEGIPIPPPALDRAGGGGTETAYLAGGCFWGVQGVSQHLKGVTNAVSGYAGGEAATASYRAVGSGRTGHAEAVAVSFDPDEISYGRVLQIFFSVAHDPTEKNRQGPDVGPQYRSAIFPADAEQARVAEAYVAQLDAAGVYARPIATTIEPGHAFYLAEDYHQDYLTRHPEQPYIVHYDMPKLANLKELYPAAWRDDPVLVSEVLTN